MLKLLFILALVGFSLLILSRRLRIWFMEEVKALSDRLLLLLLRATSRFGSELTEEGKTEQRLWRERRLRDLRGLALRSRQQQQKVKEKTA